ncbi:AAA family ATPase [Thermosulfurimonas dismutans]|uniref:Archaeal ATPase, fused to C-terminal DUF234 domain n=1 Tax=Thermosulfurimonas dismutans TaxID=999894 RepID=A0A179D3R2_9BACT|nr:ATP-binding protein [Thermosulfurimonas dismutans]OAQ20623.1 archaeal ATPase, fused to C-terminal DUF234 domain [Thermosulfurimonas dismutans]
MRKKFVGRQEELERLEFEYRRPGGSLVTIYGRRRVGKTRLVRQFGQGKPLVLYFQAQEVTLTQNLAALLRSFNRLASETNLKPYLTLSQSAFSEMDLLESFIRAATARARETGQKFVFILDEFPRLLKRTRLEEQKYPSFDSFIQRLWDEGLSESPVMFILLGSSVSMMQEAFSDAAAPLFGRRTASLALRPLAMDYLAEYLDLDLRVKDHRWQTFYLYALLGGVPFNWEVLSAALEFEEGDFSKALMRIFTREPILREEFDRVFREEPLAGRILKAIVVALSRKPLREEALREATGIPSLSPYLSLLQRLGVVEPDPEFSKRDLKKKKFFWRISDPFLCFLGRFGSELEESSWREPEVVWQGIEKRLSDEHLGPLYEFLWRKALAAQAPPGMKVGQITVPSPSERKSYQVDVIGVIGEELIFLAEVKLKGWSRNYFETNVKKKLTLLEKIFKVSPHFKLLVISTEKDPESLKSFKQHGLDVLWLDYPYKEVLKKVRTFYAGFSPSTKA